MDHAPEKRARRARPPIDCPCAGGPMRPASLTPKRRVALALRAGLIAGVSMLLASCALFGGEPYSATGAGITVEDEVPAGGGYATVGQPYVVAGRTYVPREDPTYARTGVASWYGADFHGQLTANGERYDMTALTAAHPTLPLPSYVRVTNLQNGASLVVRVNDRGPFVASRIIDVSAQTALLLGFHEAGTASVRVEYVGRAGLEGDDTRMLMATYVPPGARSNGVAYNAATQEVQMAAARGPFNPFRNGNADVIFRPAALPPGTDPLAHITTAQAYAPADRLSPAQIALRDIATAGAREPVEADEVLVQVGVFADRSNAERIAVLMRAFGAVTVAELTAATRPLWSVRVTAATSTADATIAAAVAAGATGAYRL